MVKTTDSVRDDSEGASFSDFSRWHFVLDVLNILDFKEDTKLITPHIDVRFDDSIATNATTYRFFAHPALESYMHSGTTTGKAMSKLAGRASNSSARAHAVKLLSETLKANRLLLDPKSRNGNEYANVGILLKYIAFGSSGTNPQVPNTRQAIQTRSQFIAKFVEDKTKALTETERQAQLSFYNESVEELGNEISSKLALTPAIKLERAGGIATKPSPSPTTTPSKGELTPMERADYDRRINALNKKLAALYKVVSDFVDEKGDPDGKVDATELIDAFKEANRKTYSAMISALASSSLSSSASSSLLERSSSSNISSSIGAFHSYLQS